jgi:hypothetical protein
VPPHEGLHALIGGRHGRRPLLDRVHKRRKCFASNLCEGRAERNRPLLSDVQRRSARTLWSTLGCRYRDRQSAKSADSLVNTGRIMRRSDLLSSRSMLQSPSKFNCRRPRTGHVRSVTLREDSRRRQREAEYQGQRSRHWQENFVSYLAPK